MPRDKIIRSGEIGEAIKRRRKELGYSQEWLAEFLGVSYQRETRGSRPLFNMGLG